MICMCHVHIIEVEEEKVESNILKIGKSIDRADRMRGKNVAKVAQNFLHRSCWLCLSIFLPRTQDSFFFWSKSPGKR